MTKARILSARPFVEQVSIIDGRVLRVGYRADGADYILASVELPIEVLEQEIVGRLELVTTISPSGEIVSQIFGSSGLVLARLCSTISIDHLVSQTVDSDKLRQEELPTSELSGLLSSLEASIERVRTALAQRA